MAGGRGSSLASLQVWDVEQGDGGEAGEEQPHPAHQEGGGEPGLGEQPASQNWAECVADTVKGVHQGVDEARSPWEAARWDIIRYLGWGVLLTIRCTYLDRRRASIEVQSAAPPSPSSRRRV